MAEYRNGHWAEADVALTAAREVPQNTPPIYGTPAFYQAMSLFRQGKKDEARKLAAAAAARMKPLPADDQIPLGDGEGHEG